MGTRRLRLVRGRSRPSGPLTAILATPVDDTASLAAALAALRAQAPDAGAGSPLEIVVAPWGGGNPAGLRAVAGDAYVAGIAGNANAARNAGAALATGDHLWFLDHRTRLRPGALALMAGVARANPGYRVIRAVGDRGPLAPASYLFSARHWVEAGLSFDDGHGEFPDATCARALHQRPLRVDGQLWDRVPAAGAAEGAMPRWDDALEVLAGDGAGGTPAGAGSRPGPVDPRPAGARPARPAGRRRPAATDPADRARRHGRRGAGLAHPARPRSRAGRGAGRRLAGRAGAVGRPRALPRAACRATRRLPDPGRGRPGRGRPARRRLARAPRAAADAGGRPRRGPHHLLRTPRALAGRGRRRDAGRRPVRRPPPGHPRAAGDPGALGVARPLRRHGRHRSARPGDRPGPRRRARRPGRRLGDRASAAGGPRAGHLVAAGRPPGR